MAQGLADKPEIVALNKTDALTPEQIKQQVARLKRAARRRRCCSRRTGEGVPEALRALLKVIDEAAAADGGRAGERAVGNRPGSRKVRYSRRESWRNRRPVRDSARPIADA